MKDFIAKLPSIFAVLGVYIGWFLGGVDSFLYALIAFVVIDYLTGLLAAALERRLSSEVGFRGVIKKVMIFALVGVGNIVDVFLIGNGCAIRIAVIFFYVSNEGISILENTCRIGLPIPRKLKKALEQFNEEEKKNV